jgi:CheY-like chemotaxis protein
MRATITKISEKGLSLHLENREIGVLPIEEVFSSGHAPVILKDLIYVHPINLAVGQSIPVVAMPDHPGCFSRKRAVLKAFERISVGEVLSATIVDFSPSSIFALTEDECLIRLPFMETEKLIVDRFKTKRLSLDGVEEEKWLYLGDRIRVTVLEKRIEGLIEASLVVGNPGSQQAGFNRKTTASSLDIAPVSPYKQVLIIDDNDADILALEPYFREGGYPFDFSSTEPEVLKWCDGWLRVCATARENSEYPSVLVLLCLDPTVYDWKRILAVLEQKLPSYSVILTTASPSPHNKAERKEIEKVRTKHRTLGEWKKDAPLEALSSMICGEGALTVHFSKRFENVPLAGKDATTQGPRQGEIARRIAVARDCAPILELLVQSTGPRASPCAAVLFQIDRTSHRVTVISEAGEERIAESLRTYEDRLHKSPVRDLAIYHQVSDIANAREAPARFVYFLDAVGGLRSDLSVVGVRPNSPPGSPFAYALFLFSKKLDAFAGNKLLSDHLLPLSRRFVEVALAAADTAGHNDKLKRLGEEASDLRFMAHELREYLDDAQQIVTKAKLANEDRTRLRDGISRAWMMMAQMLPGTEPDYEYFSPIESVRHLLRILTTLQLNVRMVALESELDYDLKIHARRLVFECVLHNLVMNAIQQIDEYCNGRGEVSVRLNIEDNETGSQTLVAQIEDDGPGIHAKNWDLIFTSGKSTRRKGMGLGLAGALRFAALANGKVELVDSHVYSGATFRLILPIRNRNSS